MPRGYRNDSVEIRPKTKTINITLINGGVGDLIAALTPIDYILRKYPWVTPITWVPDMMVDISRNLLPDHAQVYSYTDMRGKYDPSRTTKTTQWDGHTSAMRLHCVDYAYIKLCDELPPIQERNYLRLKPCSIPIVFRPPVKYVVITTGYTADVKEFRAEYVNEVAKYVRGRGLQVVFLGSTATKTGGDHVIRGSFSQDIDYSQGFNMVDHTTLLEAASIMYYAKAVVGVDNGLLHVAGTTDVPIVGGFTFVSPESKMPYRYNELGWNFYPIVPDEDLKCKFCQVNTNFLYGHDYRKCMFRKEKEMQDRVNLCTKQMRPEKFIKQLEKILWSHRNVRS